MTARVWHEQVLIAVDQLCNAAMGGWADETVSARAHRRAEDGCRRWRVARFVINCLFIDRYHCQDAYASERMRMHIAPEYREWTLPLSKPN